MKRRGRKSDDPAFVDRQLEKFKNKEIPMERVIVDTRDGSLDRLVPHNVVRALYRQGVLVWDSTNARYAVPENGVVPPELKEFKRV